MNEQSFSQLMTQLDVLGAKIGVMGSSIWSSLLREQRIEAYLLIGWSIFLFLIAVLTATIVRSKIVKFVDNYSKTPAQVIPLVVSGITLIPAFCCLTNGLWLLMNPQYWALYDLMSLVHTAMGK